MTESRETAAKRRARYVSQGLTSKGKPRKPRARPAPHQAMTIRKGPKKKVETPEQKRDRGRMLMASPLALSIEERVRKRLKAMG